MGSPTKKHKTRRVAKLAKQGQKRKNHLRSHGSTSPDLALDKPNANEQKQKKLTQSRR
jgi:hypothetical protein